MSSEAETPKLAINTSTRPKPEDIAAALEEARQNARLLRVSSSLFLREAKELIDADKASVLVWASDFLDGSTEDAKGRLQELKQSTTSCGVPSASVESKKLLAELVGLGKIGGRSRRQAICLLAVVLDPIGEEAPALTKLLGQLPQEGLKRKKSASVPPPVTPTAKAAPSKATYRHHYTPDAPSFQKALAQKDSLPVLRRTGSLASSRRSSDAGQASRPESAQQDSRSPATIPEGASLNDASSAAPKASASETAAATDAEQAPASATAPGKLGSASGAQLASEPANGTAVQQSQGLSASEPVNVAPGGSSSSSETQLPAPSKEAADKQSNSKAGRLEPVQGAKGAQGNGSAAGKNTAPLSKEASTTPAVKSAPAGKEAAEPSEKIGVRKAAPASADKAAIETVAADKEDSASETSSTIPAEKSAQPEKATKLADAKDPVKTQDGATDSKELSNGGASVSKASPAKAKTLAEQTPTVSSKSPSAFTSSSTQPDATPAKTPSREISADAYTPGAGMPEAPRRASQEAPAKQEPAERAGSGLARPEEVSAFRMTRRKRSGAAPPAAAPAAASAAAKAPPPEAALAGQPAAPATSPADTSEEDDRPDAGGQANGKAGAGESSEDAQLVPPALKDMVAPLQENETEAAKAVWTGTPVEPATSK